MRLFAQATDPESRVVIGALARIAGRMAQLDGAGAFDIRGAVADAAGMAITAKRRGKKLADIVLQGDLDLSPEAVVVARFMADNIRSGQRIADGLLAWVDLALDQVRIVEQNASSTGMFGEEPTLSRQQLFERLGKNGDTATAIEEPAAQRGGTVATGEGAERREAEPAGDGRGAEDGAGGRGAETEGSGQQVERGPFGPIFTGLANQPEAAIEKLMAEKSGEVPDAFTHPELGPIAFVYGDEKMGLRHIEAKRGIQWVNRIPEILRSGKIDRDPTLPRVFVVQDSDPANVAVIRLDWDGQQKTWLVTAHQDDKGRWGEQGKTSRTTLTGGQVQGNPSLSDSPAGSVAQDLLGDKPNTSQQQAADERARRAGQDQQRRNAAPAPEEFALGMEDARTGREVDPRQQDMELLRQVDEAVQDADADTLPGFSRKPSAPWRMEAGDEVVIADINRAIAPSGAQVTAVASFDELPQLVKEKAKAHGVGPKEMRGITLGGGRVFVVHGNHSSLADVQATIVHEVYGYVGLRALFGPDIYRRLNRLYLGLGDSKVRALAEKYGVDAAYFDMANQLKASPAAVRRAGGATELRNGWLAEELLAHIAERETGTLRQQARELVGEIRAWLREHGFMQLSDLGMTDIAHILEQGRLALETQSDFGGVDAPPVFSRSASTKAAYEARIDALFAGGKPTLDGVRVLDRSDMLALLGMGDGPVNLAEGKVTAGQDNHPHMTAAMWKKIPQWLDNPALVFDSDTTPGRLVFIAPELVNGAPVRIIVEPNAAGSINAHLLVNAYDAERNPFQRWEREGLLRYFDQQKAPSISGTFQPRLTGLPGNKRRGKILTQKHLAGYRRANDPQRSSAPQPSTTGATVATITDAIRKAYGNVLDKLQAKGLVTLVQSQDDAIEAAAKARADKTGQPLEVVLEELLASVSKSSAMRLWVGSRTVNDALVPETTEYAGSKTGNLASVPAGAKVPVGPIRVAVGQAFGPHRGFGMEHMHDNMQRDARRAPVAETGDAAEDLMRQAVAVLRGATRIHNDGNAYVVGPAKPSQPP